MAKRYDEPERMHHIGFPRPQVGARRAARALNNAFLWDATAEGCDFWSRIYDRLEEIAAGEFRLPKGKK